MQVFFLLPQNLFDNNSSNKSHRRSKLCNTSYSFFYSAICLSVHLHFPFLSFPIKLFYAPHSFTPIFFVNFMASLFYPPSDIRPLYRKPQISAPAFCRGGVFVMPCRQRLRRVCAAFSRPSCPPTRRSSRRNSLPTQSVAQWTVLYIPSPNEIPSSPICLKSSPTPPALFRALREVLSNFSETSSFFPLKKILSNIENFA